MRQAASQVPIDPIVDRQRQRIIDQLIPKVMEQLDLPEPPEETISSITSNLYDLIEAIKVIETQTGQKEINPEVLRQAIAPLQQNRVLEQLNEQLRTVNDSSGRVQRIMQFVYEFSRKASVRSDVRSLYKFTRESQGTQGQIDVNHVIEDTLKLMRSYFDLETAKVKILKEYDAVLPLIAGNLTEIRQMILEILSCSVFRIQERDRTQRDAARPIPKGIIKICTNRQDSSIELRIVDNGNAISNKEWHQIINVESESQPNLAGCHRVIDLHGGTLDFLSEVRETAIIAKLPL